MVVAKKVAKRAVDRNRLKRLIRESFRQNQHRLPEADYVVITKPALKDKNNSAIFVELAQHWEALAGEKNHHRSH